MASKRCINGHIFEKSSSCPVCPTCSSQEMNKKYADFPKIGAPAFRALDRVGITQLSHLTKYSEKELLELHGFGPKALKLLKAELNKRDLLFSEK